MRLRFLLALVGVCQHQDTYRERRTTKDGVKDVMHLVCHACGFSKPAVDRSAKEHRHVRKTTVAFSRAKVQRTTPAKVTPIAEGRR